MKERRRKKKEEKKWRRKKIKEEEKKNLKIEEKIIGRREEKKTTHSIPYYPEHLAYETMVTPIRSHFQILYIYYPVSHTGTVRRVNGDYTQ